MKAILLISHGSRSAKTKLEIEKLIEELKKRTTITLLEYAFLEIESPSIPQGIDRCVNAGAREIIVLLNFLNAGRHTDSDIPALIQHAREKYPFVKLHVTQPIGQHHTIPKIFVEMLEPFLQSLDQ